MQTLKPEACLPPATAKPSCAWLWPKPPPIFLRPVGSTPARAAQAAVQLLANRGQGTGGLILLDKNGNPGFAFNTPRMAFGYVNTESSFFTSV